MNSDEQMAAQQEFFRAKREAALDAQSDSWRSILDDAGTIDGGERVKVLTAVARLLGEMFKAGWDAGLVEAAAQMRVGVRRADSDP